MKQEWIPNEFSYNSRSRITQTTSIDYRTTLKTLLLDHKIIQEILTLIKISIVNIGRTTEAWMRNISRIVFVHGKITKTIIFTTTKTLIIISLIINVTFITLKCSIPNLNYLHKIIIVLSSNQNPIKFIKFNIHLMKFNNSIKFIKFNSHQTKFNSSIKFNSKMNSLQEATQTKNY